MNENSLWEQSREKAKIHVIIRHFVHDPVCSAAVESCQRVEVPLGYAADRGRIQMGHARQRRIGAAQHGRQVLEGLARSAQLAGTVNAWMAGKNLLDERRARARQAEDEHGPFGVQPSAGDPREKVRRERLQQPVHELLVFGRDVVPTALCRFQGQRIGLAQTVSGAGEFTTGVENVGQTKEKSGTGSWGEFDVGESFFQGRAVGSRQVAAQQRGQSGVGKGISGLQAKRLAEGRFRLGQRALLFGQPAKVETGSGEVRLEPCGDPVMFPSLGQAALFLQRPAKGHMFCRLIRSQRQHPLPVGDRQGRLFPLSM